MSVVPTVRGDEDDGLYSGQKKRPLSIIEENDEVDNGNTRIKDYDVIALEVKAKEIVVEVPPASTKQTTSAKPAGKSQSVKKSESRKKPDYVDTSKARSYSSSSSLSSSSSSSLSSSSSSSSCLSPKQKTPPSKTSDSKVASKIVHFSKSIRGATKSDQSSKAPPPVAPKPKSSSPSPSKVKSPSSASRAGDGHFSYAKSPMCSQSKRPVSKTKTETPSNDSQSTRSTKSLVKSTVSKLENHVASLSSSGKQSAKGEQPKRKTSKEDAPSKVRRSLSKEKLAAADVVMTDVTSQSQIGDSPNPTPIATVSMSCTDETSSLPVTATITPHTEEVTSSSSTPTSMSSCQATAVTTTCPESSSTSTTATVSCNEDTISPSSSSTSCAETTSSTIPAASSTDVIPFSSVTTDSTANDTSSATKASTSATSTLTTETAPSSTTVATTSTSSNSSTPQSSTPNSPAFSRSKRSSDISLSISISNSLTSPSFPRKDSGAGAMSNHGLSDGHGLARIREVAENLKLTSPNPTIIKTSSSPTAIKVPFSFRQSPKLNNRPMSDTFSMTVNNSKSMVPMSFNTLQVPGHVSKKGDSVASDSENEDNKSPILSAADKSRLSRSPFLAPKFHPRRGSYFFKRRVSNESLTSLSENESTDNTEETTPISASDFNKLKETADRLHLSTRRPSVLQWRQQYVESPENSGFHFKNGINGDTIDERLTSERKQKIDEALDWLRNELQEMRSQDQMLARQLLTIRNDIHQLKLKRCTAEHQERLDDFKSELEELQEFSDVLDLPQPIYEDNRLKHVGITRLNISARRFSAC